MTVESEGVSREKPDELAVCKDKVTTVPESLSEGSDSASHFLEQISTLLLDTGETHRLGAAAAGEFLEDGALVAAGFIGSVVLLEATFFCSLFALHGQLSSAGLSKRADEEPEDTGEGEKNGREESRVVVAKLADQTGRGECARRTSNLVENVDEGIHALQAMRVTADQVSGDDSTDDLPRENGQ